LQQQQTLFEKQAKIEQAKIEQTKIEEGLVIVCVCAFKLNSALLL
jgi:hypothetical protein